MNIQLTYMYRDAANYKQWGSVVFANPEGYEPGVLSLRLKQYLIDSQFFNAQRVRIPELRQYAWDSELDHDWHEFVGLEETSDTPNDLLGRSITQFIQECSSIIIEEGGA